MKYMKKMMYSKEVADYLNNKFGDDFTLAEPYPYWMKVPENMSIGDMEENNNRLNTIER